jgi:hypothetical protein
MTLPSIKSLPTDWEPSQPNPYTRDGSYGRRWSCFQLLAQETAAFLTARQPNGLFLIQAARRVPHLADRLCDYLRYEHGYGRQTIVAAPPGGEDTVLIARAWEPTADARTLRAYDPAVVVHATSPEAWHAIARDGMLKSTARLRKEGAWPPARRSAPSPIAQYQRDEPRDYHAHIMFGELGQYWPELIVLSKHTGAFCTDSEVAYTPGVRLYLDLHAIIRDGLGVRDGVHQVKVHDHLPLVPYLLGAVTAEDLVLQEPARTWTPRTFTEAADRQILPGG